MDGMPAILDEVKYHELKQIVGDEFEVHPKAVVLVGSCRTGFTLKDRQNYRQANINSDVDLAIVSPRQFDDVWEAVFRYTQSYPAFRATKRCRQFRKDLFVGGILTRGLPPALSFAMHQRWAEFFDRLNGERFCGVREIKAKLYRSWERLEAYQEILVGRRYADLQKDQQ